MVVRERSDAADVAREAEWQRSGSSRRLAEHESVCPCVGHFERVRPSLRRGLEFAPHTCEERLAHERGCAHPHTLILYCTVQANYYLLASSRSS